MAKRRPVADAVDQRAIFLDALTSNPTVVRQERMERQKQFWADHAAVAAGEVAEAEVFVRFTHNGDLANASKRLARCQQVLAEYCYRAQIDGDALLVVARCEAKAEGDDSVAGEQDVVGEGSDTRSSHDKIQPEL